MYDRFDYGFSIGKIDILGPKQGAGCFRSGRNKLVPTNGMRCIHVLQQTANNLHVPIKINATNSNDAPYVPAQPKITIAFQRSQTNDLLNNRIRPIRKSIRLQVEKLRTNVRTNSVLRALLAPTCIKLMKMQTHYTQQPMPNNLFPCCSLATAALRSQNEDGWASRINWKLFAI